VSDQAENPRAIIGGNAPPLARSIAAEQGDFALVTTAFLNEEYARQPGIVTLLLNEARDLPEVIEDDATKGKVASLIKRLRDTAKALESFREKEKMPYWRGVQAVDQFFFGLIDRVARRDKKAKPGAADILLARLTDYDTRMLEAERERRRKAAEEEERKARAAQEEADRAAAQAEEARVAAERARKPETAAAKEAVAGVRESAASDATVAAAIAAGKAEAARIDTFAKPADIMRSRGEDGTLSTMATEPYAEIENEALLDKEKLWPFIALEAKERALRSWAKTVGHAQQMPGAKIGKRPRSTVR
jgi:hypothetical protein